MKEKKQRHSQDKKQIKKISTIGLFGLILIGFTVASYKSAPAKPSIVKLPEVKKEVAIVSSEEKEMQFLEKMKTDLSETERIETLLQHYEKHIFGIDVSHYQGLIEWDQLKFIKDSIPVGFVFMRASMGDDSADEHFQRNWAAAKKNNMLRGAYHYYRPDENSAKQARNFINNVKLNPGDLPPVLDIEALPKRQSISSLRIGINNWLRIVEEHYGVQPIIYTGDTFYQHFLAGHGFDEYEFWIANYNPVPEPLHPEWGIWQFSMKGKIAGINTPVDLNIFNGSDQHLQELRINS